MIPSPGTMPLGKCGTSWKVAPYCYGRPVLGCKFIFIVVSGSLPPRDGGIPGWGTIDLQIDDHLLEFGAIGLGNLVLHERLRTLLPHLVVQNALWVTHILDQRSLHECLFLHDVGEDFLQFRSELLLRRLVHTKTNNQSD